METGRREPVAPFFRYGRALVCRGGNGGSAEKEVARHEPMTHFHQYWRALFAARALTGA